MHLRTQPSIIIAVVHALGVATAVAAPSVLKAPDPKALDFFGTTVAATDDFLVTGYPARYPALKGRLFSFALDGLSAEIDSEWATDIYGDALGIALAAQDDLIVVGAPQRGPSYLSGSIMAGRLHLLRRSPDGSLMEEAFVQGTAARGELGAAVDLDGTWVIAGAPGIRPAAAPVGERWGVVNFYLVDERAFPPSGSSSASTLVAAGTIHLPAEPAVRNFGQSVAIAGGWAAASANLYRGDLPNSGIVGLMHRGDDDTWTLAQTLTAPEPFAGDRFGLALAMRDDLLAVGAPAPGQLGDAARGALYLHRLIDGAWTLDAVLDAPREEFCAGFGRSVAIRGDMVAVGAISVDSEAEDSAAVFLFERVSGADGVAWIPTGEWSGLASEDFGGSLAFTGERLAIGVPGASGNDGFAEGAVHLVSLVLGDLNGDGIVDGSDLAILLGAWGPAAPGALADINGDGIVDGYDLAILLGHWS